MILVWLLTIPVAGGLLAALAARRSPFVGRWIALVALLACLALTVPLLLTGESHADGWETGKVRFDRPWIASLGVHFSLYTDNLSAILLALTFLLGTLAVVASWRQPQQKVGLFHLNLLWAVAGIAGTFLARDLFLFYLFFEMMLIPLYFLLGLWGGPERTAAGIKFFLFTQAGGLLMLLGILGLYFVHGGATGQYTFDYDALLGTAANAAAARWMMLAFLLAFAIKMPVAPVHTWQPQAYAQSPLAGSMILAGLAGKVGAYGLLRFLLPLFPREAAAFAPAAMAVAAATILYGAVMAFAQRDVKRLAAYSSLSHMGFVLLGVFAWNEQALAGAVVVMIAHGLSVAALFVVIGQMEERLGTRDMNALGGLWSAAPRMSGAWMVIALAAMGLPGLANFVGEFLVLLGAFQVNVTVAVFASLGLVLSALYALWMVQKILHGRRPDERPVRDLSPRETLVHACLIGALVWLGVAPGALLRTARKAIADITIIAAKHDKAASQTKADGAKPAAALPPAGGKP